jgi:rubrerythrin
MSVNIIDYALQMEKDGEAYYRDLALQADDVGTKQIFSILADAEAEHYKTFLQMKENQPVSMGEKQHIATIKTLFTEIKERGGQGFLDSKQVDAYIKARDIEKKSQEFYKQKAEEFSNPEQKNICLQIAEEEGQHYIILDNLIELLQRPSTWVEDAEWRNMEDY